MFFRLDKRDERRGPAPGAAERGYNLQRLPAPKAAGEARHDLLLANPSQPRLHNLRRVGRSGFVRRSDEIDEALKVFFGHGEMGLVSVCQVVENPVLTRRFDKYGVLHPLLPMSSTVRRQDMPSFYHVDGAIYINSVSDISSELSLNDNPIGYVMPEGRSLDIDEIEDFIRAEEILRKLDDSEPRVVCRNA